LPVSLGGMINEARILGGPSPPPLRPRGRAPHMKLALSCSSPWERATDDPPHPPNTTAPPVTKQHSKAMPDPGLGDAFLALCDCMGGRFDG